MSNVTITPALPLVPASQPMIGLLPAATVTYILYGLSALLPLLLIASVKIILSCRSRRRKSLPVKTSNIRTVDQSFAHPFGLRSSELTLPRDLMTPSSVESRRSVMNGHVIDGRVTQSSDNPNIYFGPTIAASSAATSPLATSSGSLYQGQGHRMMASTSPRPHVDSGCDSLSTRRDLPSSSTTSGRISRQSFSSMSTMPAMARRQDGIFSPSFTGNSSAVIYDDVSMFQQEVADENGRQRRYTDYRQSASGWEAPATSHMFIVAPAFDTLNETSRHLANETYVNHQMFKKYGMHLEHDQEQAIRYLDQVNDDLEQYLDNRYVGDSTAAAGAGNFRRQSDLVTHL